jgi:hypothetical protein
MSEVRPRRPSTWAIVELTRLGERKAMEGTLPPLLCDSMSLPFDHPVFIPSKTYMSGGRRVTVHLMEGYAFIGSDGRDLPSPSRLEQPYIKRILMTTTSTGSKALSVLSDDKVRGMEAELAKHVGEDSHVGSNVSVTAGVYAQLTGEVLDITSSGNLLVRFRMRSLDLITEVPPSFTVPNDGTEE